MYWRKPRRVPISTFVIAPISSGIKQGDRRVTPMISGTKRSMGEDGFRWSTYNSQLRIESVVMDLE